MAKTHKVTHEKEQAHLQKHEKVILEPKRLGLTLGILKGVCMAGLALLATTLGWGYPLVRMLGSVLLGYGTSPLGIILGLFWGFAVGFIAGHLIACIYNKLGDLNF
jgi:hypothetical protein